jgi:hypothetical protein
MVSFEYAEIIILLIFFAYALQKVYKHAFEEGYFTACEDVAHKRIEVSKHEFDEE